MEKRQKWWRLTALMILVLAALAIGSPEAADKTQDTNNDDLSKQIEEKGKSIDAMSSLIEHSTDNMEDEIEKAGKDIDSPDAQKRIEIGGKGVDDLADEMDKKIEEQGKLIEESVKSKSNAEEQKEEKQETGDMKSSVSADKHENVQSSPAVGKSVEIVNEFEKQEKHRQNMEDLVELQSKKVEEIGERMDNNRRNKIQHHIRRKLQETKKNIFKKAIKKKIQNNNKKHKTNLLNRNASKRRVIIPVNRKKLEKLMMYNYVNDKMKQGQLNKYNLHNFFDNIKGLPSDKPKSVVETGLNDFVNNLYFKEEKVRKMEKFPKNSWNEGVFEKIDRMLNKFEMLRNRNTDMQIKSERREPDLKAWIQSLDNTGVARQIGRQPLSTAEDDTVDMAELNAKSEKVAKQQNKQIEILKFDTDQVHKMLEKIKMINATLHQNEKIKKEKQEKEEKEKAKKAKKSKKCEDTNCVSRRLISFLDKALSAVKHEEPVKDNASTEKPKSSKPTEEASKIVGETRSKGDPYAGIGFAATQEKPGEATDPEATGRERHLMPHGVDLIGTSQPLENTRERPHFRHSIEDDGDDDDDDDDEDEDDDDHHGHRHHFAHVPEYPYPMPMHHKMHHMHHHIHHLVDDHDHNDHNDHHDHYDHHENHGHHQGPFGGYQGDHGHTMPIRTNYHHGDHGYTEPLNVDTAPMHHYPSRHEHDHFDIDAMLRGHPYIYPHHTPEVALEGPISTASVYGDMHHMLNGPGIHDQPDVHYEVEMHAHPFHHNDEDNHHEDDHYDDEHHDDEDHEDDHEDNHFGDSHHSNHHDDDYNESHSGKFHEYDFNGDKKETIEKPKTKHQKPKLPGKHKKNYQKEHKIKKSNEKNIKHKRDYDDDDDDDDNDRIEKVQRNGHGVARLSYLTQNNGEEMEQQINNGIMDVEAVGRSIEDNVQHGVDKVTEISNHDVEAPDYDSEGHMEPTIHREDIHEYQD